MAEEPTRRSVSQRIVRTDRYCATLSSYSRQYGGNWVTGRQEVVGENVEYVRCAVASNGIRVVLQILARAIRNREYVIFYFPCIRSAIRTQVSALRETEPSISRAYSVCGNREVDNVFAWQSSKVRYDLLSSISPNTIAIKIDPTLNECARARSVRHIDSDRVLVISTNQRCEDRYTIFVIDYIAVRIQRSIDIVAVCSRGWTSIGIRVPIRSKIKACESAVRRAVVCTQSRVRSRRITPVGRFTVTEVISTEWRKAIVNCGVRTCGRERLNVTRIHDFANDVCARSWRCQHIRTIRLGDRSRFPNVRTAVLIEVQVNIDTRQTWFTCVLDSIAVDIKPLEAGRSARWGERSEVSGRRTTQSNCDALGFFSGIRCLPSRRSNHSNGLDTGSGLEGITTKTIRHAASLA